MYSKIILSKITSKIVYIFSFGKNIFGKEQFLYVLLIFLDLPLSTRNKLIYKEYTRRKKLRKLNSEKSLKNSQLDDL